MAKIPFSVPDNRHFSWEEEDGVTQIAEIFADGIQILHTVEGNDLLFSPDGEHAIVQQVQSEARFIILKLTPATLPA